MQPITLVLTQQEALVLQQLIHRALLQSGMEVAEAAVLLNQKIVRALQEAQTQE